MSKTIENPVIETNIDLHDKKETQPVPLVADEFAKPVEENPGDGKLHVEKGQEADALPAAPAYTLNPQGQRVRELRNRLRSAVTGASDEVKSGEPVVTQYHRNQLLGIRRHITDLIAEGYGMIDFDDEGTVSVTLPLNDKAAANLTGAPEPANDPELTPHTDSPEAGDKPADEPAKPVKRKSKAATPDGAVNPDLDGETETA